MIRTDLGPLSTRDQFIVRHLAGGGPERRDVLTECLLTSALPGSLVTDPEDTTCRDCRASLVGRGICPVCGETALVWSAGPVKVNPIAEGRLTMRDVETQFYLGCESCSETLISGVSPDQVAVALNERKWRP